MNKVLWGLGLILFFMSSPVLATAAEGDLSDRSGRIEIESVDFAFTDWVTGCRRYATKAYCDCLAKGFVCHGVQANNGSTSSKAVVALVTKLQDMGVINAGREVFGLLDKDDSDLVAVTLTQKYNLSSADVREIMGAYRNARTQQTADRSGRDKIPDALKVDGTAQAIN